MTKQPVSSEQKDNNSDDAHVFYKDTDTHVNSKSFTPPQPQPSSRIMQICDITGLTEYSQRFYLFAVWETVKGHYFKTTVTSLFRLLWHNFSYENLHHIKGNFTVINKIYINSLY